jgi:uncharacterized membrane protein YtjA (UPF0391 family)
VGLARNGAPRLERTARSSLLPSTKRGACRAQLPNVNKHKGFVMLYWTAVFFVVALIAAVLGFSGIAAGAAGIAKILFFVFLVLGALSLIFGRRVPA